MEFDLVALPHYFIACLCDVVGLMEERPDLLLGIIVTHVAKQQQQQQQQQQPVSGKSTTKTWMYGDSQERSVTDPAASVRSTPVTTSTPSTIIRETETIASPANQVTLLILPANQVTFLILPVNQVTLLILPAIQGQC